MSFDLKIENGDIKIGKNGDIEKVQSTSKLIQDILKIIITPLGSNLFFPWYGSPISKTLIGNPLNYEFIESLSSNQLRTALNNLQKLQQEQFIQQKMSAEEMLAAIKEIKIERSQVDPRYFRITIEVLTKALNLAVTSFEVTL